MHLLVYFHIYVLLGAADDLFYYICVCRCSFLLLFFLIIDLFSYMCLGAADAAEGQGQGVWRGLHTG